MDVEDISSCTVITVMYCKALVLSSPSTRVTSEKAEDIYTVFECLVTVLISKIFLTSWNIPGCYPQDDGVSSWRTFHFQALLLVPHSRSYCRYFLILVIAPQNWGSLISDILGDDIGRWDKGSPSTRFLVVSPIRETGHYQRDQLLSAGKRGSLSYIPITAPRNVRN